MNRLLPLAAFALLSWIRPWATDRAPTPLDPERAIASLVPERCRVYVEAPGSAALLVQGRAHPFVTAALESPAARAFLAQEPGIVEAFLAQADAWLGEPLLPALAELTARGLALGFDPATKKSVVVLRGTDEATVVRCLSAAFRALERQFARPGAFERPHARWDDADVWLLGVEAQVARRGELVVLANDGELVREVLALADDPLERGLFEHPGFAEHHRASASAATLWGWLELAELEPFADQGFRELRAANRVPAVQALLGAEVGALLSARAASVALTLGTSGLTLTLRGFDAPCVPALAPLARAGELPAGSSTPDLASAVVYRDFARFFTARSELFPAEAQPGFAEAVSNGGLFFEGRDLGTEVLAELSPWLRVVVRSVEFAPERRPEIPLPAVCLVAVLEDPRAGEAWTAAFQTIVALVNVDRAQKGGKSLALRLAREGEVDVSTARFATPGPGDGVDVRYNLEPALAVAGRHLVLGSHVELVRALVRELAGAEPARAEGAVETVAVAAEALVPFVRANRAAWIAQKTLAEGKQPAAAAREVDHVERILASLAGVRLAIDGADPSAPAIELSLSLARPAEER